MLWHIMTKYARHGFRNFVICAGYKADTIKTYFLNYQAINSDFTIDMRHDEITFHQRNHEDWKVTVADTGAESMTGYRIHHATERFLGDSPTFALTYGDGLTDADLAEELAFHAEHGLIGTVLGTHPVARFGEIRESDNVVTTFSEKRPLEDTWISGGFFFLNQGFRKYLSDEESLILEEGPLRSLVADEQLAMYRHDGFWACMDTQRDHDMLERLVETNAAPWMN